MKEKLVNTIGMFKEKSATALSCGKEKLKSMSKKQLISVSAGIIGVAVIAVAIGVYAGGATGGDEKEALLAEKGDEETAWAIKVNGEEIAAVATIDEAEAVLAGIKNYYQTDGSQITNAGFVEDVVVEARVETEPVAEENADGEAIAGASDLMIMNVEDAVSYILTGTAEPKTYVVQGGDNLWNIAAANGISVYELQDMNPQLEPEKLNIGQELYLYETKPFVTVQLTEILTATEKIEYDTVYENSDTLYKGQTQVKTAGVYGSKDIKTEVIKQNGVIVASNVVEEVVTAEPQAQVALMGTQTVAISGGSGVLSSPLAYLEVSSAYGSRGGGRHYGVDLRIPKGSPIYAADGGTVVCAKYSGSYGNIVKVDHGGGLQTYYAHCDSMSVAVGDVVTKGQQLGTVGKTGNATGYILHFEVRVNGVAQNPMNYL